jgi:hypothetical protein
MNVETGTEAKQFLFWECSICFKFFWYCVFAVYQEEIPRGLPPSPWMAVVTIFDSH